VGKSLSDRRHRKMSKATILTIVGLILTIGALYAQLYVEHLDLELRKEVGIFLIAVGVETVGILLFISGIMSGTLKR